MRHKHLVLLLVILGIAIIFFVYPKASSSRFSLETGPVVGYVNSPQYGHYLTDKTGRTLYILSSDQRQKSHCYEDCLDDWAVFEFDDQHIENFDDPISRKLNVHIRDDGWYQYTYSGHPLYYYVKDTVPGATNGLFLRTHIARLVILPESDLTY